MLFIDNLKKLQKVGGAGGVILAQVLGIAYKLYNSQNEMEM